MMEGGLILRRELSCRAKVDFKTGRPILTDEQSMRTSEEPELAAVCG